MHMFDFLCWPLLRHFRIFDNLPGIAIHWVLDLLVNPITVFSSNGPFLWAPGFVFCFCFTFYFLEISLTLLPSLSIQFIWAVISLIVKNLFLLSDF